ncbi:ABC transporter G family member 23 [Orchesella cincta]|uniref:ABC transporter G family member 23 n=1 Tax=Orchesella cincta TaxID=48709 RepID=A0A1D2MTB8_ORCCI|nr:ABC transporter G family member 23 [Orchesella cincta]
MMIPMAKATPNKTVDTVAFSVRRPALVVRGASKKYGSQLVLHNLNMFAKEGTIYALIGSGSSGKSTILQCISGLKTFTKGELMIFGTRPGSAASGIPGRRVGYLSQELALLKEFTVTEAVQYYGRMYGMSLDKVKERLEVLANILSLQNCNERLSKLSRSEQKRASIACALIHEPELIVLDEPTKALDPLFKRSIWTHLTKLVSDGRTSVILATQYIEETRQAHRVGVLRGGRLIVEDSPIALLQRHNSALLEDVIARICYKETAKANAENTKENEKKGKGKNGIEEVVLVEDWSAYGMPNGLPVVTETDVKSISYSEWMDQVSHEEDNVATKKAKPLKKREIENAQTYPNPSRLSCRLRALAIKQLIMTQRNFGYILLRFAMTAFLISLFCVAIGPDPKSIRMGLVDNDSGSADIISDCLEEEDMSFGCKPEKMSCRFLRMIKPDLISWTLLSETQKAEEALKLGTIEGYLEFTPMFSTEVFNKVLNNVNDDESVVDGFDNSSSLVVHLDSSDTFISKLLRTELIEKYKAFEEGIASDCDGLERNTLFDSNSTLMKMEESPLLNGNFEQIGYHSRFVLPGISLLIIFLMTSMTSGLQFQRELRKGALTRAFSAGVNTFEVLVFHIFIELIIIVVHVALVLVIPIYAFEIYSMNGFWPWPILLFGITGIGGLTLSFLSAMIVQNRQTTIFTSAMIYLIPNLLFSGNKNFMAGSIFNFAFAMDILLPALITSIAVCKIHDNWRMGHHGFQSVARFCSHFILDNCSLHSNDASHPIQTYFTLKKNSAITGIILQFLVYRSNGSMMPQNHLRMSRLMWANSSLVIIHIWMTCVLEETSSGLFDMRFQSAFLDCKQMTKMCDQTLEKVDAYRESFKYFKNLSQPPNSNRRNAVEISTNGHRKSRGASVGQGILLPYPESDIASPDHQDSVIPKEISYDSQCRCYNMWGLRTPESWEVAELTFPRGLIVIRNPFTPIGQRYWISRTLLDFPHNTNYITNMDNLNRLHKMKKGVPVEKLTDFKLDVCSRDFYTKLRWVTFGYHHDWDTKVYSEERRSIFPEDLADMTRYISQILGFSKFEAEAAIANYYHMDSTLSGHVDKSEVNQDAPLFSFSFGQSAIFLIGGKSKTERPQPVLLQSGDIAIMSGESRLSYHGVPKILPANSETWDVNLLDPSTNTNANMKTFPKYEEGECPKRLKLDDNDRKSISSLTSKEHDCDNFRATMKDSDVSYRLQNTIWTPFLQNYICKSRINLNIRQIVNLPVFEITQLLMPAAEFGCSLRSFLLRSSYQHLLTDLEN